MHDDLKRLVKQAEGLNINLHVEFTQGDVVPPWANDLKKAMALLMKKVDQNMKDTTKALVDGFALLSGSITDLETLVDKLEATQDDGSDETAVADIVSQMSAKMAEIKTHIPTVAAAIPPVVTAPADTTPAA